MFGEDIINIEGKNNVINQDDNYDNKCLCFYPNSEAKFLERNVKLINNTDSCIFVVNYNEMWSAFETSHFLDFHGLKAELLGE